MIKSATEKKFTFIFFEVKDWNGRLSPWKARQAFGEENFGVGVEL